MNKFIKNPIWQSHLSEEFSKDYFNEIIRVNKNKLCFPSSPSKTFRIFNTLDLDEIRVVILGQDPYHTEGQATGRCFESGKSTLSPSLKT